MFVATRSFFYAWAVKNYQTWIGAVGFIYTISILSCLSDVIKHIALTF